VTEPINVLQVRGLVQQLREENARLRAQSRAARPSRRKRGSEPGTILEVPGIKHGTFGAYFYKGCRCQECRSYQRKRNAANRRERLASGRLSHGTRSAYDCGCRCDPCKGARRGAYDRLEKVV
jgi:hypothetical protein